MAQRRTEAPWSKKAEKKMEQDGLKETGGLAGQDGSETDAARCLAGGRRLGGSGWMGALRWSMGARHESISGTSVKDRHAIPQPHRRRQQLTCPRSSPRRPGVRGNWTRHLVPTDGQGRAVNERCETPGTHRGTRPGCRSWDWWRETLSGQDRNGPVERKLGAASQEEGISVAGCVRARRCLEPFHRVCGIISSSRSGWQK